jgi:glycosyltransferase involved in cell wall biosynthesis
MSDPSTALQGRGVVYFGNDWNAENRTSSHHVATRLANHMPVLYVDSPGMRAPNTSGRDLKRAWRKLAAALRPPVPIREGFWHCTVPQLPFRRIPGVEVFNRLFSRWAVRRALRMVGITRYLSWFVVPHPGFLAHRLGEDFCVYYCIDDYAAHPGVDADLIGRRDEALSREADQLFVAPPSLLPLKQALNPTATYAPHGVDLDLFLTARMPDTPVAEGARDLKGPVVGYIGSIHEWIDIELIAWLAQQRPQWSFLLVGHPAVDVSSLRALPNVRLAGPQPYPTLPQWAKAFDAAIIPYRMNRQVANANPLKLREYLATGKPVVSTYNPEIAKFAQWVRIAEDRGGFLAALEQALRDDSREAADERVAAVAAQTWDRRVEDVLATVTHALDHRPHTSMMTPAP